MSVISRQIFFNHITIKTSPMMLIYEAHHLTQESSSEELINALRFSFSLASILYVSFALKHKQPHNHNQYPISLIPLFFLENFPSNRPLVQHSRSMKSSTVICSSSTSSFFSSSPFLFLFASRQCQNRTMGLNHSGCCSEQGR